MSAPRSGDPRLGPPGLGTARPDYRLSLGGEDITPRVNGRLIALSLTRQRGGDADQLTLTLADHDGRLALPPHGATLELALGWHASGLASRGTFIVDEVEHSGAPDRLQLRARAANLRQQLPGKRSQSWHDLTLAQLIETLAARHDLTPVVGDTLAGIRLEHIDQTDESDLNFLTRLGQRFDAIATIKAGHLLFTRAGEGLSASGLALPGVVLTRRDGDRHRFTQSDRDDHTGVIAHWNDTAGAERQAIQVGSEAKPKTLRDTYASAADARHAAEAEWRRLQRGQASLDLTLAHGRADLSPETPLTLRGFKAGIDERAWLVTQTTESLNDNGYLTQLSCELRGG
ncbi:contractile injection system protein, VgrG/Pvc8 family [Salinicola sp. RZ23]|uniref:contractile injection system protein, VgrG/Pvc8 family n=1 Tax=Salinicola sp. RZ23 TaxID=1949087 RepID=UPI000DA10D49|nr:contractile injection system protein, VgrG/Pvc8 family [Salinicola sp. RZ23]